MKRFLLIFLIFTMILCGGCKSSQVNNPTKGTENNENDIFFEDIEHDEIIVIPTTPNQNATTPPSTETTLPTTDIIPQNRIEISSELIRKNGELPEKYEDLTKEEIAYYYAEMFYAVQDLDIDKLSEYIEDEQILYILQEILNNEEYKKMYKQTIGSIIYLPSERIMVARDTKYVFNEWYTNSENNNIKIPEDVGFIDHKTADTYYNNIYQNAPYISGNLDPFEEAVYLKNGKIYFNVSDIFSYIGYASLYTLEIPEKQEETSTEPSIDETIDSDMPFGEMIEITESTQKTKNTPIQTEQQEDGYARMVFGDYYLLNKGNACKHMDVWLSLEIDKMVEIIDENYDEIIKDPMIEDKYKKYYKNENNKNKAQEWVNQNCIVSSDLSSIIIYIKLNTETYPYSFVTQQEQEVIKDIDIYSSNEINEKNEYNAALLTLFNIATKVK